METNRTLGLDFSVWKPPQYPLVPWFHLFFCCWQCLLFHVNPTIFTIITLSLCLPMCYKTFFCINSIFSYSSLSWANNSRPQRSERRRLHTEVCADSQLHSGGTWFERKRSAREVPALILPMKGVSPVDSAADADPQLQWMRDGRLTVVFLVSSTAPFAP